MRSQKPTYTGNLEDPSPLEPPNAGDELPGDEAPRTQLRFIAHHAEQPFHHVRDWQRIQKAVVVSCVDDQPYATGFDAELAVLEVHCARVELVQFREIRGQ